MENYWFHLRKIKTKNFPIFHVLGHSIPKKHVWSEKINYVCHALSTTVTKICRVDFSVASRDRELKFWTRL
jgi:hypothetical protein